MAFAQVRLERNAVDRADLLKLRLAEMAGTFSTERRIGLVNFRTLRDGAAQPFRPANVAHDFVRTDELSTKKNETPLKIVGFVSSLKRHG